MQSDITLDIFGSLVRGRAAERSAAQAALTNSSNLIDRARLRLLITHALERDFFAGKEDREQDDNIIWARAWLLGTLARISDDDVEAQKLVRSHLDHNVEPRYWVRYWTLEGVIAARAPDLASIAKTLVRQEKEPLLIKSAEAILAANGDATAYAELQKSLGNPQLQWATLRALRIVPLPGMFRQIAAIVEDGKYSDATYDAIVALGKAATGSSHAETAERALTSFVTKYRNSPIVDGMRLAAIKGLGNLQMERSSPVLLDELTSDNPGIVREAALALEKILGIRTAAERVVEAASKAGASEAEAFGRALRWMARDSVVEQLEAVMVSGYVQHQDVARQLLSEIGGAAAFQKLQARTKAASQYTAEMEKAEEKIRTLFESSIREAQRGFNMATIMDRTIFGLGVLLIGASATVILSRGGTLDQWAGIGVTGGAGVLGVLYSLLIAKPRERIVAAVDHLMRLKVVFLGYLRQLHQADQAYTRRLLDEKPLSPDEVERFGCMIDKTIRASVDHLGNRQSALTINQAVTGPEVNATTSPTNIPKTVPAVAT